MYIIYIIIFLYVYTYIYICIISNTPNVCPWNLLPGKLTNVPSKSKVGVDVFPIEIVPFQGTY